MEAHARIYKYAYTYTYMIVPPAGVWGVEAAKAHYITGIIYCTGDIPPIVSLVGLVATIEIHTILK